MINIILINLVASILFLFSLNHLAYKFKLLDIPNKRKLHKKPVPIVGGIAIGLILVLSVYIVDFKNSQFNIILSLSLLLLIVGILDDLKNLNAINKLILQSMPIFILVYKFDFYISDLGYYPFIGIIELGSFATIFTILSIFLFINACNYLDGIDGSFGLIFLSSILIIYFNIPNVDNDINYFYISMIVPLIIFLFFNLSKYLPKIFLGDAGSLLLGYLLSCLMIITYNEYSVHPIIVAWSVNLIVYDFLCVNILRIRRKVKILKPANDHIQFVCLKYTNSIAKSNFIILSINIILALTGVFTYKYLNEFFSLVLFISFFFLYLFIRLKLKS